MHDLRISLALPIHFEKTRFIVKEMLELLALDLVEKKLLIKEARQVRKCYVKGTLDEKRLNSIFIQEEKQEKFYLDLKKLRSYFPKGYTMQQCEDALWEILNKMKG